jgi:hypothetical protein
VIALVMAALAVGLVVGWVLRRSAPAGTSIDSAWVNKVMSDAKHEQKERDER